MLAILVLETNYYRGKEILLHMDAWKHTEICKHPVYTHPVYKTRGIAEYTYKISGVVGGSNKRNFEQKTCDLKHSLYIQIGVVSVTLWSHLEPNSKEPCGSQAVRGIVHNTPGILRGCARSWRVVAMSE